MATREDVELVSLVLSGASKRPGTYQILEHHPDGPIEAGNRLDEVFLELAKHANNGTVPPEGSLHGVLNHQDPITRMAFCRELKLRMDTGDVPKPLEPLAQRLKTEEATDGLMARMGTDVDLPPPSPDSDQGMLEQLSVAYDLHQTGESNA